ncbi:hypothetical protein [Bacillus fonticola]|uniref:hypothetical protein n=1 Tax=Bacillus fonticola TaxID=2728853 RepID=UPI001475A4E9|nr:hypothetical protein [Bacillus fonticola]
MSKRKQPKFQIGDTVVVTLYGTVGKITNVKELEGVYVYEVNGSGGLFMETVLTHFSEYEEEAHEREHIELYYAFNFGDIVQVRGRGSDLYKVVGFRTEVWRYEEDAWEDIVYELSRTKDGQWLEVGEEDLTLVVKPDQKKTYSQMIGMHTEKKKQEPPKQNLTKQPPKVSLSKTKLVQLHEQKREKMNALLDLYNDYRYLHQLFGDDHYHQAQGMILRKLKQLANEWKSLPTEKRASSS